MNSSALSHLLVLLSLIYVATAQVASRQDSCVAMKVGNQCDSTGLHAGVNVVSWYNGEHKCNSPAECCARSPKPFIEYALKAYRTCTRNCKLICENAGENSNLYSATWPQLCLGSCKVLKVAVYFGLYGAQCPSDEDKCLKDKFTLDLNNSCSDCLITKTLPNYEQSITLCQSRCPNLKQKKFGRIPLTQKAICSAHLYGQYMKFIHDTCAPPETETCTPDKASGLTGGACQTTDCNMERERCFKDSAKVVKEAAKVVYTKWRASCEDTCGNDTALVAECIIKADQRLEEVETKLLLEMCSFLEVRS